MLYPDWLCVFSLCTMPCWTTVSYFHATILVPSVQSCTHKVFECPKKVTWLLLSMRKLAKKTSAMQMEQTAVMKNALRLRVTPVNKNIKTGCCSCSRQPATDASDQGRFGGRTVQKNKRLLNLVRSERLSSCFRSSHFFPEKKP